MANAILAEALSFLKPAADAFIGQAETQVPTLSADALAFLENELAPKLDVPPYIVALAKGENTAIEAVVDPQAVAALEFLKTRVDALL